MPRAKTPQAQTDRQAVPEMPREIAHRRVRYACLRTDDPEVWAAEAAETAAWRASRDQWCRAAGYRDYEHWMEARIANA